MNDAQRARAPRFFLGRTSAGNRWWTRDDVPEPARTEIDRICHRLLPVMDRDAPGERLPEVEAILSQQAAVERIWLGPAFHFPASLPASPAIVLQPATAHVLRPHLVEWVGDTESCAPLLAVLVGGAAVAVCGSVRSTMVAHEAGVETAPAYRGKGYGSLVVSTWAMAVRQLGRVPLYSTSWSNLASRAVARRLGLTQFASDLHLT